MESELKQLVDKYGFSGVLYELAYIAERYGHEKLSQKLDKLPEANWGTKKITHECSINKYLNAAKGE